ncbi:hypothetical protein SDC9_133272 [bioreactor metagenome]|uniref:Uncharacterized protein n=1 Tax=bioreactor metagenome TaxID=1076179 RepID=A0A645DAH2_9ZZZZ
MRAHLRRGDSLLLGFVRAGFDRPTPQPPEHHCRGRLDERFDQPTQSRQPGPETEVAEQPDDPEDQRCSGGHAHHDGGRLDQPADVGDRRFGQQARQHQRDRDEDPHQRDRVRARLAGRRGDVDAVAEQRHEIDDRDRHIEADDDEHADRGRTAKLSGVFDHGHPHQASSAETSAATLSANCLTCWLAASEPTTVASAVRTTNKSWMPTTPSTVPG